MLKKMQYSCFAGTRRLWGTTWPGTVRGWVSERVSNFSLGPHPYAGHPFGNPAPPLVVRPRHAHALPKHCASRRAAPGVYARVTPDAPEETRADPRWWPRGTDPATILYYTVSHCDAGDPSEPGAVFAEKAIFVRFRRPRRVVSSE